MTARSTPPERDSRTGESHPDTAAFETLLRRASGEQASVVPSAPQAATETEEAPPRTRREARERAARRAQQPPAVPLAPRPLPTNAAAPAQPQPNTAAAPQLQPSAAQAPQAPSSPETRQRTTAPARHTPNSATHQHQQHHESIAALRWHDDGSGPGGRPPRRNGRGGRAWTWIVSAIVILGLLGGGGWFAWNTFQPQVKSVMKHFDNTPTDYKGSGEGTVNVTIKEGDTGATIAKTLQTAGVTMTSGAFYDLLLQTKPDPVFQPGVYRLHKHMSAASALTLLQDPSSKLERTLLIREGESETTVLKDAATATGIPLDQLTAAAANPADFGLPAQAKTLEGFLFPATYSFDPGIDAKSVLSTLVNRAQQAFQQDGVPADKLWDTVVLASIVQREAGPDPQDLPLIAGVFSNRLAQGMPLQSDATVAYGAGSTGTVWTTDKQRADASNPYNTYAHTGLPVGPIGNPGDAALKAAVSPQGSYLFFTVVNLQTGQTAFAMTEAEQEQNVAQLQSWCADPDNKKYCG